MNTEILIETIPLRNKFNPVVLAVAFIVYTSYSSGKQIESFRDKIICRN